VLSVLVKKGSSYGSKWNALVAFLGRGERVHIRSERVQIGYLPFVFGCKVSCLACPNGVPDDMAVLDECRLAFGAALS